ncbi:MAG: N-acetylglucosamine kinase [Candidatus Kapaibacterium sp.]
MSYCCAIDGGGTTTRCAIADATRVLGVVTTESAKPSRKGYEESGRILFDTILATCAEADVPFTLLKGISIGMSGVWREPERQQLRGALYDAAHAAMYPLPKLLIVSDVENALSGALGDASGVVVISGTGSIAMGRDEAGDIVRVGGYGPELGDEGSGTWIGRSAFQLMVRAVDGRKPHSGLTRSLADALQLGNAEELRMFISDHRHDLNFFSGLTPRVFDFALQNEIDAMEILHNAAEELCILARGAASVFGAPSPKRPVPVCFLGSIAEQTMMKHALVSILHNIPELQRTEAKGTALDGALERARRTWLRSGD